MEKTRLLVVDDAPEMAQFLKLALESQGHQVAVAYDAREGLRLAHQFRPDAILLDIMMPGMDGWQMLSHLREFSDVPVIMLTALDSTENKVQGLDLGADDYVTKPFDLDELHARVRAALRRASMAAANQTVEMLSFDQGRLRIDLAAHKVSANGMDVSLTPIEQKLLLYLAINAGRVLTYNQILENVWGPGYEDSETNLKVYVRRLRKKIEPDPARPRYVLTQWGIGYYMDKV
ncbi:MAG: response regulator transcription factor [Anaerolineae bacterium]|jgi:DNA-binding response OmpR family regulator|nr:response regulator transcription factor [Anaerolineae bacterium]MDX9830528.1 response regulator transcription factor [Anaerolineae bacterium]